MRRSSLYIIHPFSHTQRERIRKREMEIEFVKVQSVVRLASLYKPLSTRVAAGRRGAYMAKRGTCATGNYSQFPIPGISRACAVERKWFSSSLSSSPRAPLLACMKVEGMGMT